MYYMSAIYKMVKYRTYMSVNKIVRFIKKINVAT